MPATFFFSWFAAAAVAWATVITFIVWKGRNQ